MDRLDINATKLQLLMNLMKIAGIARRAWAEELGLDDAVVLLEATLAEEKATDEALTELAEATVNQEAEAA